MNQTDLTIHFPNGLLAFEEFTEFILSDIPENSSFKWLQSIKEESLGFLVVNPFDFFHDYEFELLDSDKNLLGIKDETEIAVFTIISLLGNDFSKSTTNLLAPIIVNINSKKGKQVVLQQGNYSTKVPLLGSDREKEHQASGKEACR